MFACYERRGITPDPATFHADVPILGDVAEELRRRETDPALLEQLDLFTQGRLGRLINAPSTLALRVPASQLRPDVGVLGVDLSAFIQSNDATLKRVLPALITNFFITTAMHGDGRPMELIIDEAWTILA